MAPFSSHWIAIDPTRSTSGLLPFTARWSFEEDGSGTKFRYSIELKSGMFGIFGMYKRNMRSDLKALKELLEKEEAGEAA